jgi:hypothetical protein
MIILLIVFAVYVASIFTLRYITLVWNRNHAGHNTLTDEDRAICFVPLANTIGVVAVGTLNLYDMIQMTAMKNNKFGTFGKWFSNKK